MRAGIGPKVVTALVALQTVQGDRPEPLWRILVQWARDPSVNTRTRNAVHNFVELFNQCAPAARPTGSASSAPCLLVACRMALQWCTGLFKVEVFVPRRAECRAASVS
jgi:hypothetical protein